MFDFIRKKGEDLVISLLLKQMKQDTLRKLFYGKTEDAGSLLKPLRETLYPGSGFTDGQYKNAILFYTQVWTRVHGGLSPEFRRRGYISQALKERFRQFSPDAVDRAIDICIGYIVKNEPAVKKTLTETADFEAAGAPEDRQEKLKEILKLVMARNAVNDHIGKKAADNEEPENRFTDDPDYGLVPEKPVFVNGFGAHRAYLNSLRTGNGGAMEYSRIGSMSVEGIAGYVDRYVLTPKDGSDPITVYLCLYGSKTSTRAPKGLKLVSVQPGGDFPSNTEAEAPYTTF